MSDPRVETYNAGRIVATGRLVAMLTPSGALVLSILDSPGDDDFGAAYGGVEEIPPELVRPFLDALARLRRKLPRDPEAPAP